MRQLFDLRVFDRYVCEKCQLNVIIPEFSYVSFQKKSLKYLGIIRQILIRVNLESFKTTIRDCNGKYCICKVCRV